MDKTETAQLPATIFHEIRSLMKFVLDMEERNYARGRDDHQFKFFKKQLMRQTYDTLRKMFKQLEEMGVAAKTPYDEDVKGGYNPDTVSQGAGYLNSEEFDEWLKENGS